MWETLEGMVREKAQEYGGLGRGLPQRIWQAEAVGDELGDDHAMDRQRIRTRDEKIADRSTHESTDFRQRASGDGEPWLPG